MALPEKVPMTPTVTPLRIVPDTPDEWDVTPDHVTQFDPDLEVPDTPATIERTQVARAELPTGGGTSEVLYTKPLKVRQQVRPLTFWTVVITIASQALLTASIITVRTDPKVAIAASLGLTICCLLIMCAEIIPAATERYQQRQQAKDLVAEMAARETVAI